MTEQTLPILQGAISAVLYQNDENGYAVLRMRCQDGALITVVGTLPFPTIGEQLTVTGHWRTHPS